ncbi:HAAS signaling domain-containing protein [Paenibacillus endoradicis]|uniref:HAAS signaling domain-containing protein n=1 Tax=Paenibacillus endoradicis TaxID=2972487 RepID=UPI0021596EEB|nr:hypothetical protein [Paenibacillus endoradicis]MCR8656163.1 hypothetical protein [Paenibacillus endoradicis]
MEIIDRYVYAVIQRVPQLQREEIEKELRGLIEDMREDHASEGRTEEEIVEAVLNELGSPYELAAGYRGYKRYLIGPELIESYLIVLKVVLFSIVIGLSVVLGIELFVDPIEGLDTFIGFFASLISASAQGFAWVTLIFLFIEHKGNKSSYKKVSGIKKEWKLSDLPPLPTEKTRIRRSKPIVAIIFTILFIMLLTFSADYFGIIRMNDETIVISFLNVEVLQSYLPFIWILAVFRILKEGIKLVTGRWTKNIILMQILFNLLWFLLALIMFMDQSLWNMTFLDELMQADLMFAGSEMFQTSSELWQYWTKILIYIVAIIVIIETVVLGVKAYGMRNNKS